MAQIAKEEALRALINCPENELPSLMQQYTEADQRDKEASLQVMVDEFNTKAEITKHRDIKKVSEEKEKEIAALQENLYQKTQKVEELQELVSKIERELAQ